MTRTRGEPPRRHAGPLPMECDYGKKLNGRCPADSPCLPIYNEPETSATERQRGGKHAYTQEKPARNALETRACRAMTPWEASPGPVAARRQEGKSTAPCSPSALMSRQPPAQASALADQTPLARAPALADQTPPARARGASRPDALGAGASAWESGDPGAGAGRPDASPNAAAGADARTKRCRIRKVRARGCDRAPSPRSRGS